MSVPGDKKVPPRSLRKIKTILKYSFAGTFLVCSCWFLACAGFNYLIIPKIIIPQVKSYCASNAIAGIKLSVEDIYFHPRRGFMLTDFTVADARAPAAYIVKAPLIDIDLDWPALFAKKIIIRRLNLPGAMITIARNRQGVWNVAIPSGIPARNKVTAPHAAITIKECSIEGGMLMYRDSFKAGDTLQRTFEAVNVNITLLDDAYRITAHTRATQQSPESLEASFVFRPALKRIDGTLSIGTPYLAAYGDYYLDRICAPWIFDAGALRAVAQVSYRDGIVQLNNSFMLTNAIARYGDACLLAPQATVTQSIRFAQGAFDHFHTQTNITFSGASVLAGKNLILSDTDASLVLKPGSLACERVRAFFKRQPIAYQGELTFGATRNGTGHGEIAGIENQFDVAITGNQGIADWKIFTKDKMLQASVTIEDLKSLAVRGVLSGGLNGSDMARACKIPAGRVSGALDLSGTFSGELDVPISWQGAFDISLSDLSVYGFSFPVMSFPALIEDGVFSSQIPEIALYGGSFGGLVKADHERWGFEFDAEKISLAALMAARPGYAEIKGTARAAGAFVGNWGAFDDARGGGSFTITDCNLRQLPFFTHTEEGVRALVKKFVFPDFKEVSATYDVADRLITIDGVAKSSTLKAVARGRSDFSGNVEGTVGLSFFSTSLINNARRVLAPYSIGVDLLGSSIQIDLSGRIPHLARKTKLKTLGWVNDFLILTKTGQSKKYSLADLWGGGR